MWSRGFALFSLCAHWVFTMNIDFGYYPCSMHVTNNMWVWCADHGEITVVLHYSIARFLRAMITSNEEVLIATLFELLIHLWSLQLNCSSYLKSRHQGSAFGNEYFITNSWASWCLLKHLHLVFFAPQFQYLKTNLVKGLNRNGT